MGQKTHPHGFRLGIVVRVAQQVVRRARFSGAVKRGSDDPHLSPPPPEPRGHREGGDRADALQDRGDGSHGPAGGGDR